jgi:hypothetical protein
MADAGPGAAGVNEPPIGIVIGEQVCLFKVQQGAAWCVMNRCLAHRGEPAADKV